MTTVSIVIPCYNEEQTIPLLCEAMLPVIAAFGVSREVEILLVDDGSTDGTYVSLNAAAPALHGRVLRHERNRGIAEAFRTGFRAAKGDVVCTMDADCTFDPRDLLPLVEQLEITGADVVQGSHYHPKGGIEGVPAWKDPSQSRCLITVPRPVAGQAVHLHGLLACI